MRCPRCGFEDSKVVDSRPGREGGTIRRRRECLACSGRFTTYERVEVMLPQVVKRDGRREPFERDKIAAGLGIACRKRPIPVEQLDALMDRVERRLSEKNEREVSASVIGDLVLDELRDVDDVAYLRFASVYLSFESLDEFVAEAARVDRQR